VRRLVLALAVPALCAAVSTVRADDDRPRMWDYTLDTELRPHPKDPRPDVYTEGDTLVVHVDGTRVFPEASADGQLGFATAAPPEVLGVYLVSVQSGTSHPISLFPGACEVDPEPAVKAAADQVAAAKKKSDDDVAAKADAATQKTDADAVAAAEKSLSDAKALAQQRIDAAALPCLGDDDWSVQPGYRGYVCGAKRTVQDIFGIAATWHLKNKDAPNAPCKPFTLELAPAINTIEVQVVEGTAAPQPVTVSHDASQWTATIPITATTRLVKITRKDAKGNALSGQITLQPAPRDTHSLVRVQAEVLATNRLRAVSFAVAVTPVSREYFRHGPGLRWNCTIGCLVSPIAILQVAGDDHTVVSFGGGLGINVVPAFQINGGLLFGTSDVSSSWRIERSWFVGVAIDPIVLSDVISQSGKGK
jgi:hypothetical protein